MCYAMLGVVLSDGGYSFLFFWGADDRGVVPADPLRRRAPRGPPRRPPYLIMMHIGFVLLLIGFVRLDIATGDTSFGALAAAFRTQPVLPLYLLFLAGFGMKAGLFPMHVWLPEAHPRRTVARLGPDVGRDDQDGRLRHPPASRPPWATCPNSARPGSSCWAQASSRGSGA